MINNNEPIEYEPTLIKCNWCEEEFEESELVKEKYLGHICWHCVQAIKSRGEKLYIEEPEY